MQSRWRPGPAPAGTAFTSRRRWLILAVVGLGNVMSALDTFIVNVAIPSIRQGLHASPGDAEMVVTVYALVFAVLLITGGRLGDLFGRTRVYLVGMAVFTGASALSGAAPVPAVLIGARALQAAGAALMVPQAYSVVQRVFEPAERVRAISFLTTGGSVAVVFAQLVGGSLIQLNVLGLGWRIVFFVNVPIGVLGLAAGLLVLPRTKPERTSALDLPGVTLVTAALLMVVVPLSEGRDLGWPPWLIVMLGTGPLIALLAVRGQRRRAARGGMPLIDLSLFRERAFSAGVSLAALSQITNAGLFFVVAVYLQTGRGLSPGMAGLAFAPLGVGYMCVAPWSPRAMARFGRATITVGYLTVAGALVSAIVVLRVAGPDATPFDLVPSIFLVGAGQGFVNSPLYATALARVRRGQEGSASGVITTFQQTGASVGVAVEGLVFFSALGAAASLPRVSSALGSGALERALWLNLAFDLAAAGLVRLLPARVRSPVPEADGVGTAAEAPIAGLPAADAVPAT